MTPARHALHLDLTRCTGCMACAVACMDQNDLDTSGPEGGSQAWRRIFQVESGTGADARIRYVSMSCMHCEDAPCIMGCPTGALTRDPATRAVKVSSDLCIGCHSCSIACPFGVPRFGKDGTMQKCDLCSARLEAGLEPACVRVCPTAALRHGDPNELSLEVAKRAATRLTGGQ